MNTQLLVNVLGQFERLDLYEDIPISIIIQEIDITDFQSRKSNFSRQFTIPATANNSKIFELYYEVNGIEFNPLVKIPCAVQNRGTDIFNGVLRLNAVIVNPTHTDFEVYIMGDVGDFISEIRDISLGDLSYTDLLHTLDYDNVVSSWEAKDNDTDGLFGGKIIYPLIHYGLEYQGTSTTPSFTYSFDEARSFDQSGFAIPPSILKPAIRVSDVITRIFNTTTYNVKSEFFNSRYFKSIYMDTFLNGRLGVRTAEEVENQNEFKVYAQSTITLNLTSLGPRNFQFFTLFPDGYDPLNNFVLSTSLATPSYFKIPYAGNYGWNLKFGFDGGNNVGVQQVFFQIVARKGTNPNTLSTAPAIYGSPVFNTINAANPNLFFSGSCVAGEYVGLFIDLLGPSGGFTNSQVRLFGFNQAGISTSAPVWDLYSSPNLTGQDLVDIKLGITNMEAVDFIKGLVTLFNLVVVEDTEEKTITIEPYNWYYNENDRIEKDFTQRLDLNSTYKIEPLSFDLSKELDFTYTVGSDEHLNKIFEENNDFNYGRFKYISSGNLLTGVKSLEIPFAALPTSGITNAPNFIIPQVYESVASDNPNDALRQSPYSVKPHLFFWNGNRFAYKDPSKSVEGTWYMLSGTTGQPQTTYPCVSHLSTLDVLIPNLVSDLNFGSTFDFFGNSNNIPVQFTPFNLFNSWWTDYINDNYSNETRRFTGRFFMEPLTIYDTDLRDKIFVKDAFYRIEKINEADLVSPKLTEISLIKERGGYYKVEPPSPYYFYSGNTAYPTPIGLFTGTTFISTSKDEVCDGTALTGTVLTLSPLPLSDLDNVYLVGISPSYTTIPIGTYLRETTGSTTFVVINNISQILEDPC